uniref:Nitroreductase n=1 Tax=Parastrongyloides trichosuri TaxID=131310 RepID=A0A0N4Z183_PARTI
LHHNNWCVEFQNICKQLVIIGGYDRLRKVNVLPLVKVSGTSFWES